jgi:hypothetical protein
MLRGGWRFADLAEADEGTTPFDKAGHATPTGEGASWQYARALALPAQPRLA